MDCSYCDKMFWLFQCKCSKWSVKETVDVKKAVFKCKYCNKSHKIKKKDVYGLSLNHKGPFQTGKEASENCRTANVV